MLKYCFSINSFLKLNKYKIIALHKIKYLENLKNQNKLVKYSLTTCGAISALFYTRTCYLNQGEQKNKLGLYFFN